MVQIMVGWSSRGIRAEDEKDEESDNKLMTEAQMLRDLERLRKSVQMPTGGRTSLLQRRRALGLSQGTGLCTNNQQGAAP